MAAFKNAKADFSKLSKDPLFMLGLGIYIGEGDKKNIIAMDNMDISILKIFVVWCMKYLGAMRFSGSIQTGAKSKYPILCREVEKSIGEKVEWCDHPIEPLYRKRKYTREYGVVRIHAFCNPMASVKVKTWIDLVRK